MEEPNIEVNGSQINSTDDNNAIGLENLSVEDKRSPESNNSPNKPENIIKIACNDNVSLNTTEEDKLVIPE